MDIYIAWGTTVLMALLSVYLLSGRGSFLIAGYNTSSKEEKAKYDEKKLCYTVGGGLSAITVIIGLSTFYDFELPAVISWLMPWGLFAVVAAIMILSSTICKVKK